MPEQLEAVHARHDQIRNDDVCVKGCEPFQCFQPIGRDLSFIITIGKYGGQGPSLPLVIIHDEYPARNRSGRHETDQGFLELNSTPGGGQDENSL